MKRLTTIILLLVVSSMLAGCIVILPVGMGPFEGKWREEVLERPGRLFVKSKILMIDISGPIVSKERQELFSTPLNTPSRLKSMLDRARLDDDIKAVLLRINSPGGGAVSSDVMYHEIERFKKETGLPVYAWSMDVCASGGYYIACAADRIWAHPGSLLGSIGVISIFPSLEGTARWAQVKVQVVKSGEFKDSGSMWRDMTKEERDHFQEIVDEYFNRFVGIVQNSRKDKLKGDASVFNDGRVFYASQALEAGLIDKTMQLDEAIENIKENHNLSHVWVVTYNRDFGTKENIYTEWQGGKGMKASTPNTGATGGIVPSGLATLFQNLTAPTFQYLWIPGQ